MNKITTSSPGVYLFKDNRDQVLYVGKASNLKARLSSYFQKNILPRTRQLVELAKKIDTVEVDSEIEALVLEANLIKKYQPEFNIQLKDDKDYLYLKIVKEKFPRVILARRRDLDGWEEYFGPYPSASSLRLTLKSLRKIFPFRTCKINQGKACFFYHIGLCPGVCIGAVTKKSYRRNINQLKLFLKGNKHKVLTQLEKEMQTAATGLDYEKATALRKKIEAINYITRPTRRVDEYLEAGSIEEIRQQELTQLAQALKITTYLKRIECYDISNFSGSYPVGSMVVFSDGKADKSEYRRFKIQDFPAPNDPGMMGEMLRRRLKNNWTLPQLIVVDGGKTQLKAASLELEKAGIKIPVVGLAKRNEEIYTLESEIIRLPRTSSALYLITRIRDEAHRFAVSFYRRLAEKAALTGS